ncbi:MAG: ACT domain-containing protein [Methanomassiliicoccus sp.]|nr:ACT domain-containing protein [Methanomassiliicoccus sp.]
MTQEFEVYVQNKPGDVAWIAEVLSRNSVNIRGISTDLGASRPMIRVVTDDEASARSALKAAKLEFSEREIEVVSLADRPGELAKVARTLSKAGINIESLYILGSKGPTVEEIAVAADDAARAKEVLDRFRS